MARLHSATTVELFRDRLDYLGVRVVSAVSMAGLLLAGIHLVSE